MSGGHLGVPPSFFHGTDKELHILKTRLMQRNQNWQTGRGLHHEHWEGGVTRLTDAGDMKAKVTDSWRSGGATDNRRLPPQSENSIWSSWGPRHRGGEAPTRERNKKKIGTFY